MKDGFAHRPEKNARADAAVQCHDEPCRSGKVGPGIFAAETNVAEAREADPEGHQNDEERKEEKEGAEIGGNPFESGPQRIAERFLAREAERNEACSDGAGGHQGPPAHFRFLLLLLGFHLCTALWFQIPK